MGKDDFFAAPWLMYRFSQRLKTGGCTNNDGAYAIGRILSYSGSDTRDSH